MNEHLEDLDLARIVGGASSPREAGEAVLHIALCVECHRRLLYRHPKQGRRFLQTWLAKLASRKDMKVEELVARLPEFFSALRADEVESIRDSPTLIRRLRGLSGAHLRLRVANSPRFHTLAFVEHSLAEARRFWHSNPNKPIHWASVAIAACEQAEPAIARAYGESTWRGALARGWAYLANGHRLAGDLGAAEEALAESLRYLDEHGRSEVRAEVLSLEASLRRDQRRFRDSWVAASEAERIHGAMGDREAAALAALIGSSALAEAGYVEDAIEKLRRSLARLPERALRGRTHFYLLQNIAWRLAEAGRPEEASTLLPGVKELSICLDEPLSEARVDWLEGKILGQLGSPDLAEAAFRKVQRAFLDSGSVYDAALVSLDLAALLLSDGRRGEAAELADDLVPIFSARGVHREAVAAGLLVARSLAEQTATVALVEEVAAYLRKARLDPTCRFPG